MKNKYKGYSKAKKVKESLPKASALLLVAGLLFILFNVVLLISDSFFDKQAPQAIKGELDLSAVALDTLHSLPLAGNWAFYWQTLRTPAEINAQRGATHHIEVPHAWVREYIDGKPMARKGSATYHLKVKTDKVYSQLAMKVPSIGTAYKLYIDDNLVAKGGKVSEGLQGAEPSYNPTILLFEPHSKVFTVTVQVSNHHY